MFHDEIQLMLSLNDLIKLDDIWMSNLLEYLYFTSDSINICLVLNLALFKYLDRNLFSSDRLHSEFDFPKCSFAQCLLHDKMRNLLQVSLAGLHVLLFSITKDKLLERFLFLFEMFSLSLSSC